MKCNEIKCRLCDKSADQINGYLARVNEKGVAPIMECRPLCDATLTNDEAVVAAVLGEQS